MLRVCVLHPVFVQHLLDKRNSPQGRLAAGLATGLAAGIKEAAQNRQVSERGAVGRSHPPQPVQRLDTTRATSV